MWSPKWLWCPSPSRSPIRRSSSHSQVRSAPSRFCAEEGITPILPPLHPRLERRLVDLYAECSGKPPGTGVGVLRDVIVADSDDEAQRIWSSGPKFCGAAWFAPFGFDKGPGTRILGTEFDGDYLGEGLAMVGTVATVTRQLERLRERLLAEWIFTWQYNGLVSDRQNRLSIERWATEVVPRVTAWEGPGSVD